MTNSNIQKRVFAELFDGDNATLRRVARVAFSRTRAFSVASSGALELVLVALRARGLEDERDRLMTAVQAIADAVGVDGVANLPAGLAGRGRPTRTVSQAIRCDEMETALRAAFQSLGWTEFLPLLTVWSPTGNGATDGVELSLASTQDRRTLLVALASRALAIEQAMTSTTTPAQSYHAHYPAEVPERVWRLGRAMLGVTLPGTRGLPPVGASSRHGNRVGRAVASVAMAHARRADQGGAPAAPVRRAFAVLAAVAEAIGHEFHPEQPGRTGLRVVEPGAPVRDRLWAPTTWWPVLDAWGGQDPAVQLLHPTAWDLSPAEADVLVWLISWATAWVVVCSEMETRPSDAQWAEHVSARLDPVWALRCAGAWELMQSRRRVEDRSPWPSPFGSDFEFERVELGDAATLPWGSAPAAVAS